MADDDVQARLVVHETLIAQCLLVSASLVVMEKGVPGVIFFLNEAKATALIAIRRTPPAQQRIAEEYLDRLLAQVSEAFAGYPSQGRSSDDGPPPARP